MYYMISFQDLEIKMQMIHFVALTCLLAWLNGAVSVRYTPDWKSLDSRPLPSWYDEAKVGVFIHWGVFSAPSYGIKPSNTEAAFLWDYWNHSCPAIMKFIKENYPPDVTYADFAASFSAELFDPNQWADIFQHARIKYIVLVSKHHEGFTNWPSSVSWNWNAMSVGPKRDLVGELASAIRRHTDIRFGLYHSLFEWFNPLYLEDKAAKYTTQKFVERKTMPELYEIVNAYKPDVVWSDGAWEADYTYWNSTNFLAWLYNDSPVKDIVVTNDRWGKHTPCHHGGFYTCTDKYNPKVLQKHKWENCMTLDLYSWGFRRTMEVSDVISIHDLLTTLIETISCGGNLLMNVGPTGDGRIVPVFEERLRQFGDWMSVNEEAVIASKPWAYQNDTVTPYVWYTSKGAHVYAFTLEWPTSGQLVLAAVSATAQTKVSMLGYHGTVQWSRRPAGGITVNMPKLSISEMPCDWVWTFRLQGVLPH